MRRGILGGDNVMVMLFILVVLLTVILIIGISGLNAAIPSSGSMSPGPATRLDTYISLASMRYSVSASLIKAVIKAESDFNPSIVSSDGAIGLMQVLPATARSLGDSSTPEGKHCNLQVSDLYDSRENIMAGTCYLSYLLVRYNYNTEKALAAYNAGPGNVDKYNGIPPFAETQKYVQRVTGCYSQYSSNTGSGECAIPTSVLA
jgi:soluble lytic murein transglycosylase-like protein